MRTRLSERLPWRIRPERRFPPLSWLPGANPPQAARWLALGNRSEEHTSELQSQSKLVCRLLLVKKHQSSLRAATVYRELYHGQLSQPHPSLIGTAQFLVADSSWRVVSVGALVSGARALGVQCFD